MLRAIASHQVGLGPLAASKQGLLNVPYITKTSRDCSVAPTTERNAKVGAFCQGFQVVCTGGVGLRIGEPGSYGCENETQGGQVESNLDRTAQVMRSAQVLL
jgi:hypothetical protein